MSSLTNTTIFDLEAIDSNEPSANRSTEQAASSGIAAVLASCEGKNLLPNESDSFSDSFSLPGLGHLDDTRKEAAKPAEDKSREKGTKSSSSKKKKKKSKKKQSKTTQKRQHTTDKELGEQLKSVATGNRVDKLLKQSNNPDQRQRKKQKTAHDSVEEVGLQDGVQDSDSEEVQEKVVHHTRDVCGRKKSPWWNGFKSE